MAKSKLIMKSYRVLETVTTVEGTLYKDDIVTLQDEEKTGDWRVKDNMGRIWFVKPSNLTKAPVKLSRRKI
jgi:hypothetical protein